MNTSFFKKIFSPIIFGSALGLVLIGYTAWGAFQPPTAAPPGNNVEAPINVSSTAQDKAGVLRVTGFRSFADALIVNDSGEAYLQLDTTSGPPSGTCDGTTRGRMIVDTTGGNIYVCVDAGWIAK